MQTESAFTPWTLVHNEIQGCFEIKVDTAPGKFSARIASTYSDNELAEKDARLIAAAPKLRQALEMIAWSNDSKWQADCAAEALALVNGSGTPGVEE
jgi:hypothetical protein